MVLGLCTGCLCLGSASGQFTPVHHVRKQKRTFDPFSFLTFIPCGYSVGVRIVKSSITRLPNSIEWPGSADVFSTNLLTFPSSRRLVLFGLMEQARQVVVFGFR